MLLTIAMIILVIGLFIDGYLNYNQQRTIESLVQRLDHLEKQSASIDKIHYDSIHNINGDLEALRVMFYDLKNVKAVTDYDSRINTVEKNINSLYADLDRSIGAIDQVQQRIEEMEVLLRNSINQLREGNE